MSGDVLKGQSVVARVERVDVAKLKKVIGKHGKEIDLAFNFADWKPKAAIDVAIPFIRKELANIGIDATIIAGKDDSWAIGVLGRPCGRGRVGR